MLFNVAEVHEAVAAANPDRPALITAAGTLTYQDLTDESRRLASALTGRGLGCRVEREQLAQHESGQDHLAIYLHNGPEYVVSMLGAFKARLAPVNVNYRYVAEELRYLLTDSGAKALVFHDAFAPTLAPVIDALTAVELLVQVPDGTGHDLLPGAIRYATSWPRAPPTRS